MCSIIELPDEVLAHIFEFCGMRSLLAISLVCKRWNTAKCHYSAKLYHSIYLHDFGAPLAIENSKPDWQQLVNSCLREMRSQKDSLCWCIGKGHTGGIRTLTTGRALQSFPELHCKEHERNIILCAMQSRLRPSLRTLVSVLHDCAGDFINIGDIPLLWQAINLRLVEDVVTLFPPL